MKRWNIEVRVPRTDAMSASMQFTGNWREAQEMMLELLEGLGVEMSADPTDQLEDDE